MDSSASRLLHLLSLFSSRPRWSATELAERLGVTTRTVRRDIADLRDLGYPIDSEAGRTGGYQLGAHGKLPPLLLTDDEAVAVAVGLRATASTGIADHEGAAVAAMAKLEQVLPAVLRDRVRALHEAATLVIHEGGDVAADPATLLIIAQACRRHERIRFTYRREEEPAMRRRVEPYGLACVSRRWYALVWDLDRRDWRTFRVDRINEVELTGHQFDPREAPDTQQTVLSAIAQFPYDVWAEVILHISHEEAAAEVLASVALLEPHERGTLLRVGADDLDWIARYLVRLGFPFEVVAPDELRDALRRLGESLVEQSRAGADEPTAISGTADR
jgi:predicted DNA-binding transcriptional regulator YafY